MSSNKESKGQISIDFLLAVIIFATLFSIFFVFGELILDKTNSLRENKDLINSVNEIRPNLAVFDLPDGYSLKYKSINPTKNVVYDTNGLFIINNGVKRNIFLEYDQLKFYFGN